MHGSAAVERIYNDAGNQEQGRQKERSNLGRALFSRHQHLNAPNSGPVQSLYTDAGKTISQTLDGDYPGQYVEAWRGPETTSEGNLTRRAPEPP